MKLKENQNKLFPELEKVENKLDISDLQEISENINKSVFIDNMESGNNNEPDTYFKTIIDNLFNDKDISLKTEYLNEDEQFCGSKLDFLIKKGGLNVGKTFLFNWEKKRVSLGRKSRQEIIMSLWEREKERQQQEQQQFNKNINM